MKTSTILICLIISVMLDTSVLAIATPTLTLPTSGGTLSSNGVFNVSFSNGASIGACAIYASSPNTANSSASLIINLTNTTENNALFGDLNGTFGSSRVLEDSNDYTFYTVCINASGGPQATSSSNTGVIVSRTTPDSPSSVSPSGVKTTRDQTFSATVTAETTSYCSLVFQGTNPGNTVYPMTHSGNTCSLSLTNLPNQIYNYVIRASDGVDNADSSVLNLQIDEKSNTAAKNAVGAYIASGKTTVNSQNQLSIAGTTTKGTMNPTLKKELTGKELTKTGIGALVGGVVGASGLLGGPLAFVTIPVGAIIGGAIGVWL